MKMPQLCAWPLLLWLAIVQLPLHATDADLKVSESDGRKAAIVKPAPEYPLAARQLKVSGHVELQAIVSVTGEVEEVRILTGNPMLTHAASDAFKKWKFTPFVEGGKAVPAMVSMSFEFTSR